ncbi:MAG: hypothetical protein WBB28_00060 [Crinalium sp.]
MSLKLKISKIFNTLNCYFAYTRFKAMAATGNPEEGLRILAKLDALTESE